MGEIVNSVKRVTDIMAEISAASNEQSTGIEQINQAVTQMDEVTQQNAALVEEAAAASESLSEEAQHLSQSVSVFKLNGVGHTTPQVGQVKAERPVAKSAVHPAARVATHKPILVKHEHAAPVKRLAKAPPQQKGDGGEEWAEF